MKIAYNPKDAVVVTATTAANNDILFDLNARKVWAKGLRMGADWEDISNKPSSLKNPEAIKFRDINGAEVSYDGSIARDLMAGTYIAKLPYGFSSFTSEPTWGNVIGTSIASWNDSTEGSIDFRKDNPLEGKMSIKVNGRVYVNGGFNPVLSAEFNNDYWGIRTPDGGNDWIRTPNAGLLPYTYGKAGSGNSSLGTSEQYFSTAYIDQVYGNLRGNADNADTVDGEHASSFVRAGTYEWNNLNNLDTYSFIRSINSNTPSTSPKGMTGWYNVIQAVHRNGLEDGPEYMGQIALGMTTNNNKMFFRTKYRDSWYAWNEVATTDTALLRYSRNNVNISSSNCSPIPPSLLEWTIGYPRLYDPEFNDGYNTVYVYNNANNGVVTVTRVYDTNVGNSSSYVMKVVSAEGAYPNYGGWNVATQTELGKVYTCLFRASIPSGVEIEFNTNSIGNGGQWSWLTDNMGTSKWTWYAVQVYCGSGGSTTFFFSAKSPCTWYLSYVNVIENNRASYAGLRSVYSDYLKQNNNIVFGRNELQYFNQYTNVTTGANKNANPKADWHYILRMNHANERGYFVDLAIPFNDNRIQFRRITGGYDNGWRRIITEEPNYNVILCDSSEGGNVGIGISNPSQKLDVLGNIRASGQIVREASSVYWYEGRNGALLRETSAGGYHTLWSLKTTDGSWDFGEYTESGWNNVPLLSYITDSNYNSGNNTTTYQIKFPLDNGTIALTKNIPDKNSWNYDDRYVRAFGTSNDNINSDWGQSFKTFDPIPSGTPPEQNQNISILNIGENFNRRKQLAFTWNNDNIYYRRHTESGFTSWKRLALTSDIPTITNYYWANVQISTSSNSRTNPSFDTVYAATRINMGDIYLQNWNEINSTTSDLYINYNNTHNVKICNNKEGSVIIGPIPNDIGKNKLYVNGPATFTGLVTNIGGILPASYDVNKSNTSCYVWGDAMSTGVTAITDALDPKYVTVVYSQSNGASWIDANLKPEEKFVLYANNGAIRPIYLGGNRTADSSGPNSLAQIQKNQLMVTFEIPNNMYSQLCWASVEISNGVNTVCTVEILDKSGTIKNTFTKNMQGWSMVNYINFWGINSPAVQIGQDSARFIRFKFKHDKNNTDKRNALIYKIRLFSFTKYYLDSNDFRSVAAYTGNLYKYDKDLNITFPNAIYCNTFYCNTLNVGDNINCLADTISIKSKDGREIIYYDSNTISFLEKAQFVQRLCIGTMGIGTDNNITTDDTSALIGEAVFNNTFTFTFKRGYDGQLLFLKLQKGYSNTKIYCATQDCSVVKAMNFETHIAINDTKEVFGDGKARIFIYQNVYKRWYEFYCG